MNPRLQKIGAIQARDHRQRMFCSQCTFITAGREYKLSGRLLGAACNRGSERTWEEHNWGNHYTNTSTKPCQFKGRKSQFDQNMPCGQ